jgi:hypothetical protein
VLWGERRHGGTPLLDENELKRPSKHPDFGHFSLVLAWLVAASSDHSNHEVEAGFAGELAAHNSSSRLTLSRRLGFYFR